MDLYLGMLSGTSRDGVDAVLVSFKEDLPHLHSKMCMPYPADLAAYLKDMISTGQRPDQQNLEEADKRLASFFSHAARTVIENAGIGTSSVAAIGSHGQTLWHDPAGPEPETIQSGNPQQIARDTGIVTVGNFRQADMKAGGQGAPLAPLLHRALFRPAQGTRVVLNLGGIANISIVSGDGSVSGFDTGPANCLLDAWIQKQRNEPYDRSGDWSASGAVDSLLLLDLMNDPYFKKPAPKSTGVEHFNLNWLESHAAVNSIAPRDVQATLAQLTASTVAAAVAQERPGDVLVCGGGAHNDDLLQRLRILLPGCPLVSTGEHGLDPDCVEAVLFAWLARERIAGRPQDTSSITGAREPVLLGDIFQPDQAPHTTQMK